MEHEEPDLKALSADDRLSICRMAGLNFDSVAETSEDLGLPIEYVQQVKEEAVETLLWIGKRALTWVLYGRKTDTIDVVHGYFQGWFGTHAGRIICAAIGVSFNHPDPEVKKLACDNLTRCVCWFLQLTPAADLTSESFQTIGRDGDFPSEEIV